MEQGRRIRRRRYRWLRRRLVTRAHYTYVLEWISGHWAAAFVWIATEGAYFVNRFADRSHGKLRVLAEAYYHKVAKYDVRDIPTQLKPKDRGDQ